jgi:hypothetical protein
LNAIIEPAPDLPRRTASNMPAQAQACASEPGHFDELRGCLAEADGSHIAKAGLTPQWQEFFNLSEAQTAAEMDQRYASLQRQIRDNGVTYNVYADQEGPQRPWSLGLFPLIVDAPAGRTLKPACCSACACSKPCWPTSMARRIF